LVVHISLKATWGTLASPDLCSFYDEFGKNVKQSSVRTQIKQPAPSSQKLPEGEKESSHHHHLLLLTRLPPPLIPSHLTSSPPLSPLSPQHHHPLLFSSHAPENNSAALTQTRVIWAYVNLSGPTSIQDDW
jgi:hypothetical protein